MSNNVWLKSGKIHNLTPPGGVTSTGVGNWLYKDSPYSSFQATVTGSGSVSATLTIEVSNDGVTACATPLATITLSGTNSNSDGFTTQAPWKYVRYNVSSLTGTLNVLMGV